MIGHLNLWPLISMSCAYVGGFGGGAVINHAKRESPRWRERSDRQRRLLARLPGGLVGFGVGLVLTLLFDH